jgi:hypothetical protein
MNARARCRVELDGDNRDGKLRQDSDSAHHRLSAGEYKMTWSKVFGALRERRRIARLRCHALPH